MLLKYCLTLISIARFKYESFFNQYKPKDIVYPNAIARHFDISLKEAYNLCQNRVGKDLRTL